MGYKPFFKEYTTDWDYAVAKMNGQPFIRRLVHSSYTANSSWPKQVELSSGSKPTNAEYEEFVIDLAERASSGSKIATAGMDIEPAPIKTNGTYVVDGVDEPTDTQLGLRSTAILLGGKTTHGSKLI